MPRGRRKGIPNKSTLARKAAIAASGLSPVDYLLSMMRDESAPRPERVEAAKAAAPYCHARLAPVEAPRPAPEEAIKNIQRELKQPDLTMLPGWKGVKS
jgi:hypothetical protein